MDFNKILAFFLRFFISVMVYASLTPFFFMLTSFIQNELSRFAQPQLIAIYTILAFIGLSLVSFFMMSFNWIFKVKIKSLFLCRFAFFVSIVAVLAGSISTKGILFILIFPAIIYATFIYFWHVGQVEKLLKTTKTPHPSPLD